MPNQEQHKLTKDQLKVIALKDRIGQIVSEYEESIADMRANFTQQVEALHEVIESQDEKLAQLEENVVTQKKE